MEGDDPWPLWKVPSPAGENDRPVWSRTRRARRIFATFHYAMMNHSLWRSIGGKLGICRNFSTVRAASTVIIFFIALVPLTANANAQSKSNQTLEGVFRQLDAHSKDFHSVSAEIERTKVTVV